MCAAPIQLTRKAVPQHSMVMSPAVSDTQRFARYGRRSCMLCGTSVKMLKIPHIFGDEQLVGGCDRRVARLWARRCGQIILYFQDHRDRSSAVNGVFQGFSCKFIRAAYLFFFFFFESHHFQQRRLRSSEHFATSMPTLSSCLRRATWAACSRRRSSSAATIKVTRASNVTHTELMKSFISFPFDRCLFRSFQRL